MTPLRWAYPKSYRLLQEMTATVGVHPYEFEVRVDERDMARPYLMIQRDDRQWERNFDADDLLMAGILVQRFFDEILETIVEQSQLAYQNFMQDREV